jgi:hypothetical protein
MRRTLLPALPLAAGLLLGACAEEPQLPLPEVRGKPIRSARALPREVEAMTGVLASEAPPAAAPRVVDGYLEVKFELLTSYDYEWSPTTGLAGGEAGSRIPAEVRDLDRRKVLVTGYMQPIDFDHEGVKSFLLTNYPGACCFGMIPRLNEWIEVTLPEGERVDYSYFDPVELRGVLEVGEAHSGEVVTSLYRMTPDSVEVQEP